MLDLPTVTLLSIVHDGKNDMPNRVARVMNWCLSIIRFRRAILLSCRKPEVSCKAEVFQFPDMALIPGVQTFIVHMLGLMELGEHVMGVHEDGFPTDTGMWDPQFLAYDYIGAPWGDRVVGNNGLYMCSRKFRLCTARLPFINHALNSDNFYCRDHRKKMEEMGIKYAPFELARKFSVETAGQGMASFGYHGRHHNKAAYELAWKHLAANEGKPSK